MTSTTATPAPSVARLGSRRHVPDPCPLCRSDLGGSGGITRRTVVFSPQPGVFAWRCPDCTGSWVEQPR
jgi:hypothetical protein